MVRCIESWKKYLPDYEFKLWNEDTFNINEATSFVREAYEAKYYAFVSDYVRFYVLKEFGGIYLDTDVEVLRPIDDSILCNDLVLVLDDCGYISGSTIMSSIDNVFIGDCLKHYHNTSFNMGNYRFNTEVINTHMQNRLKPYGYICENKNQMLKHKATEAMIYSDEYFHVRSLVSGRMNRTVIWVSTKTQINKIF